MARIAHVQPLLKGAEIFGQEFQTSMAESNRYQWHDSNGGGGPWWPGRENQQLEASVGQRCHGLFPARYGVKGNEHHLGFARDKYRSLYVVVSLWYMARVGRFDKRENHQRGKESI